MSNEEITLNSIFLDVINSIPTKIYEVLSSIWGKILATITFCGMFLGDRLPLFWYITFAIIVDAVWGVATSLRFRKFIFSKLITKSAIKIFAYVSIYALVALVEKGFSGGDFIFTSSIIAAILISSELWSILGHIGVAYPDFMVIKILRKYLKGEMAKKLGIPEDELDEILYNNNKQKKYDTEQKDSSNT